MTLKRHEWKTVSISGSPDYGDYGYDSGSPPTPSTVDSLLYAIEAEGWEILSTYVRYSQLMVICRRPFVPATMRTED